MRRFTAIKGLSEVRRMPRAGKIRLGIKVKNEKGTEYPKETDYFVCPEEVQKVYGKAPKELDIMFPTEDIGIVFPQAYEYYGSSKGLKCTGDGETAIRYNEETKSMDDRECPCEYLEQGKCKQRGHLMVLLPLVSMGAVYQIDTSSINSIIDLNSSFEYLKDPAMLGRFAMIPLKLYRERRETHKDGKKQIHYTMRIAFEGNISVVNQLRQDTTRILDVLLLPAPTQENPELDAPDIIEGEAVMDDPAPARIDKTADKPKEEKHPEFSKEGLDKQISEAGSIDDINEILSILTTLGKSNELPEADIKSLKKACSERVPQIV